MLLEAFCDALPDVFGKLRGGVELARSFQMPTPRGESDDNGGADGNADGGQVTRQPALTVSLLTYEPRFVAEECWYVDAEISPLALAYPFVRLGLVRYQPHAPAEWHAGAKAESWLCDRLSLDLR
jgi:hypothetical protein